MDKIKIGINKSSHHDFLSDYLRSLGFSKDLELQHCNQESLSFLKHSRVDVILLPLKQLPTSLSDELVIAGLTPRSHCRELLLLNPDTLDTKKTIKLKENAAVGVQSIRQAGQLASIRNDIVVTEEKASAEHLLSELRYKKLDGCVIAQADLLWEGLNIEDMVSIKFHPSEVIPGPGDGVMAFVTHKENLTLRRLIKKVHHRHSALCTNVERRLLKRYDGNRPDLSVHCHLDSSGFFHAYASIITEAGNVNHVSSSQSTHLELDNRLYNLLNQKQ